MTTTTEEITPETIQAAEGDELSRLFHLIVLDDDLTANTDERIQDVLDRSVFHLDFSIYRFNGNLYELHAENPTGWNIWRDRDGQPYQADLEDHVVAYRARPRPWATDPSLYHEMAVALWHHHEEQLNISPFVHPNGLAWRLWTGEEGNGSNEIIRPLPGTAASIASCLAALAKRAAETK